jgi:hypothetical protein
MFQLRPQLTKSPPEQTRDRLVAPSNRLGDLAQLSALQVFHSHHLSLRGWQLGNCPLKFNRLIGANRRSTRRRLLSQQFGGCSFRIVPRNFTRCITFGTSAVFANFVNQVTAMHLPQPRVKLSGIVSLEVSKVTQRRHARLLHDVRSVESARETIAQLSRTLVAKLFPIFIEKGPQSSAISAPRSDQQCSGTVLVDLAVRHRLPKIVSPKLPLDPDIPDIPDIVEAFDYSPRI